MVQIQNLFHSKFVSFKICSIQNLFHSKSVQNQNLFRFRNLFKIRICSTSKIWSLQNLFKFESVQNWKLFKFKIVQNPTKEGWCFTRSYKLWPKYVIHYLCEFLVKQKEKYMDRRPNRWALHASLRSGRWRRRIGSPGPVCITISTFLNAT
jgi:hypothetical protein